jgi:hypothetical protein
MPPPNTRERREDPRVAVARRDSSVAQMTREVLVCERCAEFSRELLDLRQCVRERTPPELRKQAPARLTRSKVCAAACGVASYANALLRLLHVVRPACNRGDRQEMSGLEHA